MTVDAPAFLCEVCHDQPWWRIERADAAVSWACSADLSSVCMRMLRPGRDDRLSIMETVPVVDAAPIREQPVDTTHEHRWAFDGDDPYVICECGERRDALSGRVIRTPITPISSGGES